MFPHDYATGRPYAERYVPPSCCRHPDNRTPRGANEKADGTARKRLHGGSRKRKKRLKAECAINVSMAQWRAESGSRRAQAKRDAWLRARIVPGHADQTLYDALQATPPARAATSSAFAFHCRYTSGLLPHIIRHTVGERRVRRLRFHSYCQRLAALDALCTKLCNGRGKRAVVVLGACQCSSGFGYFPAPLKELRRRLELYTRVVVLDEHYTSQRCSRCAFAAAPSYHRLDPGRCGNTHGAGASNDIHGVRWCPECETVWNRDVNAARNIRQVFLHMIQHGNHRPEGFKHEGALDDEPAPAPAA